MYTRGVLVLLAMLLASCSKQRRADPPPARIKDSVPERVAAQNAANRDLQADPDGRRWGIDEARRRREEANQRAEGKATAPLPTTSVDLKAPPTQAKPAR
jgi:hypothetical protein